MHQSDTPPPPPPPWSPPQSPPEMPPPLQMEFETQGFETPPPPPPLQMEIEPQGYTSETQTPPPLRTPEQPPLPLPPRLRMAGMQDQMENKPQEQFYSQIPPEQAAPLAAPTLRADNDQPQQSLPSHVVTDQLPLQTLPRPAATQATSLQVPTLPPPNQRRGAAAAAPILASINPNNQITVPALWSTNLCGCHNDLRNCLVTCCCPCVTFGEISEIIDKGSSTCMMNGLIYALLRGLCGCACVYSCTYRDRMRRQFNLKGSNCGDFCIHLCCEPCALCQEYRELKFQGFDLSRGWDASLELRSQGVMMPPITSMGMRR